jgi:hypothetical protein
LFDWTGDSTNEEQKKLSERTDFLTNALKFVRYRHVFSPYSFSSAAWRSALKVGAGKDL